MVHRMKAPQPADPVARQMGERYSAIDYSYREQKLRPNRPSVRPNIEVRHRPGKKGQCQYRGKICAFIDYKMDSVTNSVVLAQVPIWIVRHDLFRGERKDDSAEDKRGEPHVICPALNYGNCRCVSSQQNPGNKSDPKDPSYCCLGHHIALSALEQKSKSDALELERFAGR